MRSELTGSDQTDVKKTQCIASMLENIPLRWRLRTLPSGEDISAMLVSLVSRRKRRADRWLARVRWYSQRGDYKDKIT